MYEVAARFDLPSMRLLWMECADLFQGSVACFPPFAFSGLPLVDNIAQAVGRRQKPEQDDNDQAIRNAVPPGLNYNMIMYKARTFLTCRVRQVNAFIMHVSGVLKQKQNLERPVILHPKFRD
ncbi:uncharacterized protein MCYG_06973 [Microsporum canis CBS 113480]|uniref:Uncharacterized protein n=1 Tax=Arthroderma otae (strain ATCC MYA-4605 / CBS 113480) TaxID=554155 RepID=C5FW70_ARTOC|nr:uncharacterized protein MCYG_06973 [Microsporum canis CBS 113480]EEQ34154.1 predicted protein [Microsporum canis CBS 113480]